jgi:hypothetical protein
MNTQSVRTAMTRLTLATVTAVILLIANPLISKANNNKEKEKAAGVLSAKQVSVQYTGTNEGSILFRVKFDNPTAQKFSLIVKNHLGDVLYSGQFTDSAFSKTVRFMIEDEDEMTPTFIIRIGSQQIEQSFSVNKSTQSEEEMVVTKL